MTIKTFCLALLLSLPLSAQAALTIQHWQTPRGAQVIFVESHELPILDISVDFAAGSARDPGNQAGLAQLTHILLDQGAGGLSDTAIAHRLADVGPCWAEPSTAIAEASRCAPCRPRPRRTWRSTSWRVCCNSPTFPRP